MVTNQNLRITIIGGGRSGISCAKLLHKFGHPIFISEQNFLDEDTKNFLKKNEIPFEEGSHNEEFILNHSDAIVLSPGIPQTSKLILQALQKGLFIFSEIEAASWYLPDSIKCLGITGTNGKSTTTNYLTSLINKKYTAFACGNIGLPMSEIVLDLLENKIISNQNIYLCIELSSYQLETTYSLKFDAVCILNLQNDHLLRYKTMDEYRKAKWRLTGMCKNDGVCILEENLLKDALKQGLCLPKCEIIMIESVQNFNFNYSDTYTSFGRKISSNLSFYDIDIATLPICSYGALEDILIHSLWKKSLIKKSFYSFDDNLSRVKSLFCINGHQETYQIEKPCLMGPHNAFNVLCASIIARHQNVPKDIVESFWIKDSSTYEQLPHRLQEVYSSTIVFKDSSGRKKRIFIINDSKSTNVESTLVALKSFLQPKSIYLLLGGKPKGDSFRPLIPYLGKNVEKIYAFGEASTQILNELSPNIHVYSKKFSCMLGAAQEAFEQITEGAVLLLSPACASFDEFKNYEHRGIVFMKWAESLATEGKNESNTN